MKIESLTEDQEFMLEQVKQDWINFSLLEGDELDEKAARQGIDWLYHISGLKKPITIIVDSPLGVQYGVAIAKELLKNLKLPLDGSQVESQVRSQVVSQVESRVVSQVESRVESRVVSQVRSQVASQVASQVRSQVRSQNLPYESFAGDTLAYWASWIAWAEVFEKLGAVKHSDYKRYKKFMRSGVFMGVYLDGLAVVCRRPSAVRRDNDFNLHSDQLPSIEWRDGYKLHYLHGVAFDEELWQKIIDQKLTLTDIAQIGDADKSAVAIQMLRPDRLLKQVGAKLICTGIKGTRLYEVKNFLDTGETEYCMRMTHPTLPDREFIEWVEPEIGRQKDADLAQATAFGITKEDYLLAVEA